MPITRQQYDQLIRPLNASRVAKRTQAGRQLSYLESWEVRAHLIRLFGYGNWDGETLSADKMFEREIVLGKDEKQHPGYEVGYKVIFKLTVRDQDGMQLCTYTEAAVGSASLPDLGECHDMAIKTAESDALKRCAVSLGTQFGLSLYDNGSLRDVVKGTLVTPGKPEVELVEKIWALLDTIDGEALGGPLLDGLLAILPEIPVEVKQPEVMNLSKEAAMEEAVEAVGEAREAVKVVKASLDDWVEQQAEAREPQDGSENIPDPDPQPEPTPETDYEAAGRAIREEVMGLVDEQPPMDGEEASEVRKAEEFIEKALGAKKVAPKKASARSQQ